MKQKGIRIQLPQENGTEKFSFNDRLAIYVVRRLGSMGAVYGCIGFILFWMYIGYETYEDPYPFSLLMIIINIVTLVLLPLIMVGQNLVNRKEQIRADNAREATMTSYENILIILECLEENERELLYQTKILNTLLTEAGHDPKEFCS